jgi:ABC-type branched-subunit amino acid transport system ATPase component
VTAALSDLSEAAPPALGAVGLTVNFGGIAALSDVDLHVPSGTIVGLVGPNGAGKSTAFAVLSGLLAPTRGRVTLGGVDVTTASPQARARRGLARTFQQPELFNGLSVREHVLLADRMRHHRSRAWRDAFAAGALRRGTAPEDERIDRLLELLGIPDVASRQVGGLPLGTSRLVEVARALATDPSVLLLDEPMSGLSDREAEALGDTLTQVVGERGTAVVLVEHDVPMVLRLCSMIFVLDFGAVIASGTPSQIRSDPAVQTAYLGDAGQPPTGTAR